MEEELRNLIEGAKKQGASDNDVKRIIDLYIADSKKKVATQPTAQKKQLDSRTQQKPTPILSDTEETQLPVVSDGLGGPPKSFPKRDSNIKSVMYGDVIEQPNVLVQSLPLGEKPKKYYRIISDQKKEVDKKIAELEERNTRLGRRPEDLAREGTYQSLIQNKQQLDSEFKPAELALQEVKKQTATWTRPIERLISSATDGKYSLANTETIKLNKDVEDKIIDSFDDAPEETRQKWYKGSLPTEQKEKIINNAKIDVLNKTFNSLKQETSDYLKNIKDNPNISEEDKSIIRTQLVDKNNAFNTQVALDFSGNLLKNNFKVTDEDKKLDEAIFSKYEGFIPETADMLSRLTEGIISTGGKVLTGIPTLALLGAEQFNKAIGASKSEDYTPIEATVDLINDATNYNFLPSSKSEKGAIVGEDGKYNWSYRSITRTLADTLPFTLQIINSVKKGRIEGSPQSMVSQLLNPSKNKAFSDNLRAAETAYKVTIGDNYKEAKDLGMDDSRAFTYSNVMSLAEGVSESIMPDFKYFDSLTGATLKNVFKGNLKEAVTKQAVKNVTRDFFKNVASEIGEEEFSLAVEDGLKYSLLLNHENSEFFNIKKQKELVAATVIMSGAIGGYTVPGKFIQNKKDIYNSIHKNIYELQDSFNDEINSPLNDEKAKETLKKSYTFASEISNAISNSPENVTSDQIDLLVKKKSLEEKKKNIDTAFHSDINEEIDKIDSKIRDISKQLISEESIKEEIPVKEVVTEEVKPTEVAPEENEGKNMDKFYKIHEELNSVTDKAGEDLRNDKITGDEYNLILQNEESKKENKLNELKDKIGDYNYSIIRKNADINWFENSIVTSEKDIKDIDNIKNPTEEDLSYKKRKEEYLERNKQGLIKAKEELQSLKEKINKPTEEVVAEENKPTTEAISPETSSNYVNLTENKDMVAEEVVTPISEITEESIEKRKQEFIKTSIDRKGSELSDAENKIIDDKFNAELEVLKVKETPAIQEVTPAEDVITTEDIVPTPIKPTTPKEVKSKYDITYDDNGNVTKITTKKGVEVKRFIEYKNNKGEIKLKRNPGYTQIEAEALGVVTNNKYKVEQEKIFRKALDKYTPTTEYEVALEAIAKGIKVNNPKQESGDKAGWVTDKKADSIEVLAEKLATDYPDLDEQSIRGELIDIINSNSSLAEVRDKLVSTTSEDSAKLQRQEADAFLGGLSEKELAMYEAIKAEDDYINELSDEDAINYYEEEFNKSTGFEGVSAKEVSRKTVEEKIKLSNAKIDEVADTIKAKLKAINDLFPNANINIDDYKQNGFSANDIIDMVAKIAKSIAEGGIVTANHISEATKAFNVHFEDIVDEAKVLDSFKVKESTNDIEAFRDKIKDIPESGKVSKYLSGETIERVEGETPRNAQEIDIMPLVEAGIHGKETVAMAKEVYGDKYIEKTLEFLDTANLKAHEKALVYVSLENEMFDLVNSEPNNVGLKKLQDLVRAKSQQFLRESSLAINMGRLRAIMKDGFNYESITDKFLSGDQLRAKKEIEKAIQSDASAIQKEYEEQEGNIVENEKPIYTQKDFDVEIQKAKDELGKNYGVSVFENLKRQAKKDKLLDKKEDLKAAKAKVLDDIRKVVRESRGEMSVNPISKPIEFTALVAKLAKIYIQEGALSLEEVANNIYNDLKDMSKDISKESIINSLKSKPKRVISEATKRKIYIALLNKNIESLNTQIDAKKRDAVNNVDKYKNDAEIKDLRDKRTEKRDELAKVDPSYAESRKLATDLKLAQKSLDEYQRRINENELTPKEKDTKVVDAKLKKLRQLRDTKKKEYLAKKKKFEDSLKEPAIPPTKEELENKKYLSEVDSKIKSLNKRIEDLKENKQKDTYGKSTVWNEKISALENELKDLRESKKEKLSDEEITQLKINNKLKERERVLEDLIENKKKDVLGKSSYWSAEISKVNEEIKTLRESKKEYLSEEESTQQRIDRKLIQREKVLADLIEGKKKDVTGEKSDWSSEISRVNAEILRLRELNKQNVSKELSNKQIVNQALIEAGFGKEITVKGKKRNVLDWKKLAGEEGSVDKIKENVEKIIGKEAAKELEDEYNNLRASIIEKSLNELERRNIPRKKVNLKTSAKKLAEIYNQGAFEKESDTYDHLMNTVLGMNQLDQESFNEAKKLSKSLAELFSKKDSEGNQLEQTYLKHAERVINKQIERLLSKVAWSESNGAYKAVTIAKEFVGLAQRNALVSVGQAIENTTSGYISRAFKKIGFMFDNVDTKALKESRNKLAQMTFKDITLGGGLEFGDVTSPFITKSKTMDLIVNASDSKLYHALASTALGKPFLESADSMHKAALAQGFFHYNLIKILRKKGYSKSEAKNYVSEQLTGQSFEDALVTSKEIIDKINENAGKKVIPDSKESIYRFANDLVNEALVQGNKITLNELEASLKSAETVAGFELGHEPNNIISKPLNLFNSWVQTRTDKAVKDKKWNDAAALTAASIVTTNILNPYVGGGTNWTLLAAQKAGIPTLSTIYWNIKSRGSKLDLSTEEGIKNLEKDLKYQLLAKNANARMFIGAAVTLAAFALAKSTGADDDLYEWLKKNPWANKYMKKTNPPAVQFMLAQKDKKLGEFLGQQMNIKADAFDEGKKLQRALKNAASGKTQQALGGVGQLAGSRLSTPIIPWRVVKDVRDIYRGLNGLPGIKHEFKASGFASGYFQGGMVEQLGLRPEDVKDETSGRQSSGSRSESGSRESSGTRTQSGSRE